MTHLRLDPEVDVPVRRSSDRIRRSSRASSYAQVCSCARGRTRTSPSIRDGPDTWDESLDLGDEVPGPVDLEISIVNLPSRSGLRNQRVAGRKGFVSDSHVDPFSGQVAPVNSSHNISPVLTVWLSLPGATSSHSAERECRI